MEALGRWDLHRELPPPPNSSSKRGGGDGFSDNYSSSSSSFSGPRSSRSNYSNAWGQAHGGGSGNRTLTRNNKPTEKVSKVCNFWIQGNCGYGEKCRYLHSWSIGDNFLMVAQLEGHLKVVSGIALPSDSNLLYTRSKDETVRVWDCTSGQVVICSCSPSPSGF